MHLAAGLLPMKAVAEALGVGAKRAYELAVKGIIQRRKVGGAVYITKESLEAYQARTVVPPGWLRMGEACKRTGYGRSALLARVGKGQLEQRIILKNAYLYQPALDSLFQPR